MRACKEGCFKAKWHGNIWGVKVDDVITPATFEYQCITCQRGIHTYNLWSHITGKQHGKALRCKNWANAATVEEKPAEVQCNPLTKKGMPNANNFKFQRESFFLKRSDKFSIRS